MMRWLSLVAILLSAGLLMTAPAGAGGKAGGKNEEALKAHAADVDLLSEAFSLAESAKNLKVPELYVAAGRLLLRFEKQTGGKLGKIEDQPEVKDENDKPIKDAKVEAPKKSESFTKLAEKHFEDALGLAVDQNNIEPVRALIKAVKDNPGGVSERGAIGGPKMIARVIPPGQSHVWSFAFDTTCVAAVGFEANAPCQCRMIANNGHQYFNQTVATGKYIWQPRQNAPFRAIMVTIRNPQQVAVAYRLFTN